MSLTDSHTIIEDLREGIINVVTIIENQKQESKASLRKNHPKLTEFISSIDFTSLQIVFDEQLTSHAKFLRNYVSLFETLLLFIRASSQQNWKLLCSYTCFLYIIYVNTFSRLT